MTREQTIQKVKRIEALTEGEGRISIRDACIRIGLSETWFYKIRKQLRSQNEKDGTSKVVD